MLKVNPNVEVPRIAGKGAKGKGKWAATVAALRPAKFDKLKNRWVGDAAAPLTANQASSLRNAITRAGYRAVRRAIADSKPIQYQVWKLPPKGQS